MSQSIQSYVSSDVKMSALEIIRAEESLPASTTHLVVPEQTKDPQIKLLKCICKTHDESSNVKISPAHVEEILREKEIELREEYDRILQREKQLIKERYNLILLNEQTRASYMLREAHRERQEKIHALQSQLQCKNLAALMYVMCTERKRSRFEKLQIIEARTERKEWWEDLDAEHSPFVMFGDMDDFPHNRRRETIKSLKTKKIKAQKTAPKEWKEISFKDMFLKSKCVHVDKIKSLYKDKLPVPIKWECLHSPENGDLKGTSKMSIPFSHRGASLDIRGTMGSILKMIATGPTTAPVPSKTALLGARDSIEIASMIKVRMSIKPNMPERQYHEEKEVLNIGRRRTSVFTVNGEEEESTVELHQSKVRSTNSAVNENYEDMNDALSVLGSVHTDSLQMLHSRQPEPDHTINYERVCPTEKCQRLQVDSFMRSLPPYMRANPFTHFEQTFEEYETCTPEQLEMLQQRIENRKNKEPKEDPDSGSDMESPLSEWFSTGVAVQTSEVNVLPPCSCHDELLKLPERRGRVFNLAYLELVKLAMDVIHRECLFSDKIDFDRFKLIGEDLDCKQQNQEQKKSDTEFRETRYQEISEILKKHPSLLDIFQANAK